MGSQPWFKFYPSDWRADPALRSCSLASRGLWMEMLSIMHEADPRGCLLINGRPVGDLQLAALSGATVEEVGTLLVELDRAGVFSRKKNGVIYSRRMEKDENRARKLRENGKMGGNPNLCNRTKKEGLDNQPDNTQKPDTRYQRDTDVSPTRARTPAPAQRKPFDEWWSRYPHKVGKRDAEKAYASALKRGASPDDLASGVDRYIATKPPDRAWCNPATWLNQDRWADEPAPSPSRTLNGGRNGFGNRPSPADTTRGILDAIDRQRTKPRAIEHDGPTLEGTAERRW